MVSRSRELGTEPQSGCGWSHQAPGSNMEADRRDDVDQGRSDPMVQRPGLIEMPGSSRTGRRPALATGPLQSYADIKRVGAPAPDPGRRGRDPNSTNAAPAGLKRRRRRCSALIADLAEWFTSGHLFHRKMRGREGGEAIHRRAAIYITVGDGHGSRPPTSVGNGGMRV